MATKRRSWIRYGLVALGLLVVALLLGGVKFWQISSLISMGKQMKAAGPPPVAVGTAVARARSWEVTLAAVGTVEGVETVEVANKLAGVVTSIRFESGQRVDAGEVLVELDAQQQRALLAEARTRRELAALTAKRSRALVAAGAIAQAQLDADVTALEAADSQVAALEAQVEDNVVRAPFAGKTGIRAVNVGQYLQPGTTITTVDAVRGTWVDFSLPQEEVGDVAVGDRVEVAVRGGDPIQAKITAIDPALDRATRSLRLRASVPAGAEGLRTGMFVTVTVILPVRTDVVVVPRTAVVHAPYGDSVFVVQAKPADEPGTRVTPEGRTVRIARQQFVKVGRGRGDLVAIDDGLAAGQTVVSAGAFKLRNGAPIVIDNSVEPEAKLAPRPENR